MARESLKSKRARAAQIVDLMNSVYPNAETELNFENDPFHLTIAVMLSAQTTDKAVNKVTPVLWERYPTIADLAAARVQDVEEILRSIGFFRTKAANCIGIAQMVLEDFGGVVPCDMASLQKLPGVGRKSANVITNAAFGKVEGIAVDTHVFRLAHRLKLSSAKTPLETEKDLMKVFPQEDWGPINHQWVMFGRYTCTARNPKCGECALMGVCPSLGD